MIKPVKGNDGWSCPACNLPAKKKKSNISEHIQYKHVSSSEWKSICPKCDTRFVKNSDVNRHFRKCQGVGKKIGGGRPLQRVNVQGDNGEVDIGLVDIGDVDTGEDEARDEFLEENKYENNSEKDSEEDKDNNVEVLKSNSSIICHIMIKEEEDSDDDEDNDDNFKDYDGNILVKLENNVGEVGDITISDRDDEVDSNNREEFNLETNEETSSDNKKRKLEEISAPRRSERKPLGVQIKEKMEAIEDKLQATDDTKLDLNIVTFPEKGRGIVVSNLNFIFKNKIF